MKRSIAAVIVLIMLACMATVSASTPGASTDPLITLSYLEGGYATSLREGSSGTLGAASDKAISRMNEIYRAYIGYSFAPRFTPISLAAGNTVELSMGASFILLSGSAALSTINGTVINVSTGTVVAQGTQLAQYQRYFAAEDTTALITASSATTGQIDGFYLLSGMPSKPSSIPFIDVSVNDWYYAAVEFVYKEGIFSGTSANTFSPYIAMTRGMFVTVLYNLEGRPATGAGGMFWDVTDPGHYCYNAVTWANSKGIVTGYPDGTFRPDDTITREQMAVTMHRYAKVKGRDMSADPSLYNSFPDRSNVSEYAIEAFQWAITWKVINGSDGRLLPKNTAVRMEVAQIVLNYCEKIGR